MPQTERSPSVTRCSSDHLVRCQEMIRDAVHTLRRPRCHANNQPCLESLPYPIKHPHELFFVCCSQPQAQHTTYLSPASVPSCLLNCKSSSDRPRFATILLVSHRKTIQPKTPAIVGLDIITSVLQYNFHPSPSTMDAATIAQTQPLADRSPNARLQASNGHNGGDLKAAAADVNSLEYHRQVLQEKLARGEKYGIASFLLLLFRFFHLFSFHRKCVG